MQIVYCEPNQNNDSHILSDIAKATQQESIFSVQIADHLQLLCQLLE